ncbi:hypothetical protein B5E84_04920 [Lachnoclostridium sp. An14]|uniref:glycosyltransferase n=1 Tax=Lachnoclostridium sp. An14 TaxID=1965562 RepID=UPI000B37391B|nr:glycosyltransferase [Lachnoclostridium sp. An14]OUQ20079.1 hypothetical protein B5E84_04920 [Lachnoclostridium sp. An14]
MKIVYFAPIPFDEIKQRPQCLAEELSKSNEIWYVEPTVSLMRCMLKGNGEYRGFEREHTSNLHIVRLSGKTNVHEKLKLFDIFGLGNWEESFQIRPLLEQADVVWIGYEGWFRLFVNDKKRFIVYDKMDDNVMLTQNRLIKKFLKRMYSKLVKRANVIFVTAHKFLDDLNEKRQAVYLVPNGVGFEKQYFGETAIPISVKKRIGYIGMIGHWFDVEGVRRLALANRDAEIILVGPNYMPVIDEPNVKYYGKVPKSEVNGWIESFDVCLYPFKKSELLDTIDPVKIYEYLACNKPVIAVHSREIEKYDQRVYSYDTIEELIALSKKELEKPFKNQEELQDFFKANSWQCRAEDIIKILEEEIRNEKKSDVSVWN